MHHIADEDKEHMAKKQYKLSIPTELYDEIKVIANARNTTVAEVFRRAIKWELLAEELHNEGGKIMVQRKDEDTPIEVLRM